MFCYGEKIKAQAKKSLINTHQKNKFVYLGIFFLGLAFIIVLFRTAWLSDDSYITFRTVDNFVSGYGLTWNTGERVQAYTHPLWMFLMSGLYSLTHEIYLTCLIFSIVVSLGAVTIFAFAIAPSKITAALGISIFIFSKAFIDYSTSGLENPLTHLLLAIFLAGYLRVDMASPRNIFLLSLVAALGMLNRMDIVLLFFPALAFSGWRSRSIKGFIAIVLGFFPFVFWELFSLIYYGFFFPNTAYAKLNTGIGANELAIQGLYYFLDSVAQDPITILFVSIGLLTPLITKNYKLFPVSFGIILYLLYIVMIGGDFMSGRFLAAPLFIAVALVSQIHFRDKKAAFVISAVIGIGLISPNPPVLSGGKYGADYSKEEKMADAKTGFRKSHGITDERGFYFPVSGFLIYLRDRQHTVWPDNEMSRLGLMVKSQGKQVMIADAIGYLGFFAGPEIHVIDPLALADPLLARLPSVDVTDWRIGHFERLIPHGYGEALQSGRNMICDRNLAAFYEKLAIITRGKLFEWQRLMEIWNMNLGRYDHLINGNFYRKVTDYYDVGPVNKNIDGSNPANAYIFYNLSTFYACQGSLDAAIENLEIAARLRPDDSFIQGDLSAVKKQLQRKRR